ncbi:class I adenylate-forming enzyme family protein [Chelatococcus reniformis]|uniref:3-methylmercaptopropionyl-CoA ligase n=1 Tax=Chelatococcus reniformis TaxID=1494448 RepID=A0A916UXZ7_9HYPH|nr:AMP-binding protein [Chelatococcus reniformis]GGC93914.1 4-coumarate--CoA ligase [Chelatococcus reniformis]
MLRYEFDCLSSDILVHNARAYANSDAVVCEDRRLSWKDLNARVNRLANLLTTRGVHKGDKVCTLMSNSIEAFVAFWGTIKAGAVIVPLNPMLDKDAFARLADASDAVAMMSDGLNYALVDAARSTLTKVRQDLYLGFGFAARGWEDGEAALDAHSDAEPCVRIGPEDTMTIIYSSGTTGEPKGIEHTHGARLYYFLAFSLSTEINRNSVAICSTPIYATGTWITMFPAILRGAKIVLLKKFTPEDILRAIETEGGTHTFMVPAQYIAMLQADGGRYNLSSLKVFVTAGQPLPEVVQERLLKSYPGVTIREVYGASEGYATIRLPDDVGEHARKSVGKPNLLDEFRIIGEAGNELPDGETGEIVAYGPGIMKGYYKREDLTRAATWISPGGRTFVRSGDAGFIDQDGHLHYVGRIKDMIKSGGINIYAIDIEDVIMRHPSVEELAVIGVPHPKWGEAPLAIIVPKAGEATDPNDIREWANSRVAKYQRVAAVILCEDLPRATYGKIQKQALRLRYADFFGAEALL